MYTTQHPAMQSIETEIQFVYFFAEAQYFCLSFFAEKHKKCILHNIILLLLLGYWNLQSLIILQDLHKLGNPLFSAKAKLSTDFNVNCEGKAFMLAISVMHSAT